MNNCNKILQLAEKTVGKSGFVRVVDVLPRVLPVAAVESGLMCDYAVVQAARVSYGNGTKQKNSDSNLIKYLFKNQHTTPFEMVQFKFHISAPLFVVRQWQRHRMSTYNEISGRYSELEESFWEPVSFRKQSILNKQSSEENLTECTNNILIQKYKFHMDNSYSFYKELLDTGVSREMARTVLPVSINTQFYWKIDLHNLLRFINLRSHQHAQFEIREYSDAIHEILKEYCPVSVEAFEEYQKNTISLSKSEIQAIRTKNKSLIKSNSGMSEFNNKINLLGLN